MARQPDPALPSQPEQHATPKQPSGQVPPPRPKLDLESLDLTVEEIENRITPGETNVFDK